MKRFICMMTIATILLITTTGCVENEKTMILGSPTPIESVSISPDASVSASPTPDLHSILYTNEFDTLAVLEELCQEEYEGRKIGSSGNALAGDYISAQYKAIGLLPLLKDEYDWEHENPQKIRNIVGHLKGQDNTKAVVVSGHYDTVGKDGGIAVSGGVDNASGVAAVLRIAHTLSLLKENLRTDIVFCAFDGEESNYIGSAAFVNAFSGLYENVLNINIDSIGLINGGSYMLGCDTGDISYDLNIAFKEILDAQGIQYNDYPVNSVRSDHVSFEKAGIANIDFTLSGILSVAHTRNDMVSNIETEQIDILCDAIIEFIESRSCDLLS